MKLMPFLPYSNQYITPGRAYDLFCKIENLNLHETSVLWKNNAFNLVAEMESNFIWPLLIGIVMLGFLDYLERYNLVKHFEKLVETIRN